VAGNTRRIVAFPLNGNVYTETLYAEVQRRGVEVVEGLWLSGWLVRNLRRTDIIHIHWPSFLYSVPSSPVRTTVRLARMIFLLAFAKLRGAKVVWTAHNLYPHDTAGERWADRLGRKIIVAFADLVFVHGQSAGAIVARELGVHASQLRVGHHGHWVDVYPNTIGRSASRARLHVDLDEYLYLYIGRCRPYKGLESLIAAFAETSVSGRLIIAGSFSSPQYLETIRQLVACTARVELVPQLIPDDEIQIYLNAADCVVLPYRAVLTSGTAMLALSFGRPVIAPNLGAIRDHVGPHSGILYAADVPQALTEALTAIRSLRFDEHAIKNQALGLTWSRLADMLLDIKD
jgi:glycosyltransferase involved in cell wall biosynthesis